MEKIELKHLAGYLPYSLNILYWNGNAKEYIDILQVLHLETKNVLGSDKHKPILRPLSDLTKEIEVNGKRFVPLTELLKLSNFDVEKMNEREQLEFLDSFTNTLFMAFDDGQKLFEWHFDIHNLIEKDLAIDINTLNKI